MITGWAILSPENPSDRAVVVEPLDGGVGETFVKFAFKSTNSGHDNTEDPVHIIAWGQ